MDSSTTRLRLGQNRANLNALFAGILLALFLAALSVSPALAAEQIVELYRGGQSQYVEPLTVAVNPNDGSCWLSINNSQQLVHLAADGTELWRGGEIWQTIGMMVNSSDNSLWVGDMLNDRVVHFAADGTVLSTTSGIDFPWGIAVNPTDGSCWVGANFGNEVIHLAQDGSVIRRVSGFNGPRDIAVNPLNGSCVVADFWNQQVVRLAADGTELGRINVQPITLASNPTDGSFWVSNYSAVFHYAADGSELSRTSGFVIPDNISVCAADGSCWVIDDAYDSLTRLDSAGNRSWEGAAGSFEDVSSISAGGPAGACWVVDSRDNEVILFSAGGQQLWSSTKGLYNPTSISARVVDSSCWVADSGNRQVVKMATDGTEQWRGGNFSDLTSVAANATDGSCWVTDRNGDVVHLSPGGAELSRTGGFAEPRSAAVNVADNSCWVADTYSNRIVQLNAAGTQINAFGGFNLPNSVAVNPNDGSFWVADYYHYQVAHLSASGVELRRISFTQPIAVAVDFEDGSCWVADTYEVVHLAAEGTELSRTSGFLGPQSLAVDQTDNSVWVADSYHDQVVHLAPNGAEQSRAGGFRHPGSVSVNPADGSCWVADYFHHQVVRLTATGINYPPTASNSSVTVDINSSITGTLVASDPEGAPLVFGLITNGTLGTATITNTATGAYSYAPTPNTTGTDSFTFNAFDGTSYSNTAAVTVNILGPNNAPVAADDSAVTAISTAATIAVLANDSDPDGDAISVTAVTQPAHGQAAINGDGTISYTPNAGYSGPDTFTYTISDGRSGTATATVTVTIANDPPVAADDLLTVNEDSAGSVAVLANDSDPEGGALTVSGVTQPAHGTAVVNPDNTVTYTPAPNFNGHDSFSYTVSDPGGATATATVTMTINPVADARDVPYIAYQGGGFGGPWAVAVNPNDNTVWVAEYSSARVTHLDPNGGLIWRSTGGYSRPYAIAVNRSDNTVWVADQGSSMVKHLDPNGVVLWQGSGFIQPQGIAVNPNDGSVWVTDPGANRVTHLAASGTVIAQFTGVSGPWGIAVNPTDDTVWVAYAGDGRVTHLESNGAVIATFDFPTMPTALGIDPRDGSIWVADYAPGRIIHADTSGNILSQVSGLYAQYASSISVNPVNGECWVGCSSTGSVARFAADGRELWRGSGFSGPYGVAVNPNDASCWVALYGANQVVHLKLNNTPPSAQAASFTTHQDQPLSGTLIASDPDGDPLTYFITQNGSLGTVVITDPASGAFTYTPNPGVTGSDSLAFKVSDGLTESPVAWVNIEIDEPNVAPVASDGAVITDEDVPVSGLLSASDSNSDPLTFSIVTNGALGTAEITDPASGAFTYTPNPNLSGTDSFTFKANDGEEDSNVSTMTVDISPVNDPPTVMDDSAITDEETPVTIAVLANDSDAEGNPFSISAVSQPAQGSAVLNPDGTITYTPAANFNGGDYFTYTVTDSEGATATANVEVYVNPVDDPPNIMADTALVYEDCWVLINVLANDTDPDNDFLMITEVSTPAHGAAVIEGRKVRYTPAADFSGTDTFTYTVAAGPVTATATVTVNVIPVDDAPLRGIVDGWHGGGFSAPIAVSVNTADSSVWVADSGNNKVIHLAADGTVLHKVTIMSGQASLSPVSASVNTSDGSVWVAAGTGSIVHLAANGTELWRGGGYMYPGAVSVNPSDGSVWVADTGHSRVVHLSATGTILWQSSTFSNPDSVTVNPNDGSCWVADTRNHLVIHLASNGTQLWSGAFTYPKSIAVNTADNSVWVAGSGGAQVLHLAANGAELWRGGSFMSPVSVSVNPTDGSVFVLDYGAYILVRLASNGAELWRVSGFSQPRQVAVNRVDGSAWVADFGGRRVWHFSANGTELWRGVGFKWPMGLSVNSSNDSVWVADQGNSRVTHLAEDGSELFQYFGANRPEGVSVNSTDGSVWVASTMGDQVTHLAANGNQLWYGAFTRPQSVSVNSSDGSVWVASTASTQVLHLAANGAELWRGGSFTSPASVSVNSTDGSVFVLDYGAYILVRLAANGAELWRVGGFSHPRSISANRVDGSVWVADAGGNRVWHFAADGTELWRGTFSNPIGVSVNPTDGSCWVAETGNHQVVLLAANGAEIWRGGDFASPYAVSANEADGSCWVTDFDNDRVVHLIADYDRSPIASDGAFTTDEDVTYSGMLSATEPNGQPMTFSLVSQGTLGAATITNAATGAFSYTPNPNVNGADSFTFKANDGAFDSNVATISVTITAVNDAPIAVADSATTEEETPVTINVLANDSDLEGDALTVSEVQQPESGQAVLNPDGTITYTPNANFNGTDSFAYTVSDGNGGSNIAGVTVTVNPVSDTPIAASDNATTYEEAATSIAVLANDHDPDGGVLTITEVSPPANGTAVINGSSVRYTPNAGFSGADSFTYTVSNGSGLTAIATVTVTVIAVDDTPKIPTVSWSSSAYGYSYGLAANPNDSSVWVTSPALGSMAHLDASGNLIWSGGEFYATPVSVAVNTTDNSIWVGEASGRITHLSATGDILFRQQSFSGIWSVSVNPNDGSVWVADTVGGRVFHLAANGQELWSAYLSTPYSVSVDPTDGSCWIAESGLDCVKHYSADHNLLGTVSGAGYPYSVSVNPVDGSVWVAWIINGEISHLAADGTELWHGGGFNSPWSVSVNVADGSCWVGDAGSNRVVHLSATGALLQQATGLSYPVSVSVNPNDGSCWAANMNSGEVVKITLATDEPPVASDGTLTTDEDTPASGALLATEPNGQPLTFSIVIPPNRGIVEITDAATGVFTYTPNPGATGVDNFIFKANDGVNDSNIATITVTINVVNHPPVAVDDSAVIDEDTGIGLNVRANDSDPDGDPFVVSAVTQPAHGSASVNNSDWTVYYSPSPDYNGTDSFTYTIDDGNGGTATATVTVTVNPVNDPPTAVDDSGTTNEDTPIALQVTENDLDDNHWHTPYPPVYIASVAQPAHGAVTLDPPRLGIIYTPNSNFNGVDSFTYTVTDGEFTSTATVTITVLPVNDPPVAVDDDATAVQNGPAVLISPLNNDYDIEGDQLTITGFTQPAHGQLTRTATGFLYTPQAGYSGPDSFQYTISDGKGGSATATVRVLVLEPYELQVGSAEAGPNATVTIPVTYNGPNAEQAAACYANLRTLGMAEMMYMVDHNGHYPPATTAAELQAALMEYVGDPSVFICPVTGRPYLPNPDLAGKSERDVPEPNTTPMIWDDGAHPLGIRYVVYADGHVQSDQAGAEVSSITLRLTYNVGQSGVLTFVGVRLGSGLPSGWEITYQAQPGSNEVLATIHAPAGVSLLAADSSNVVVFEFDFTVAGPAGLNPGDTCGLVPSDISLLDQSNTPLLPVTGVNGAFTVAQFNRPPVATDDSVTTAEDTAVVIVVLGNDSDPEGDVLTVTGLTQPANGAAVLNADGTVTYTPAANYNGADSFTYTVSDGNGGTATAAVSITVTAVNDPPVALDDEATVIEDTSSGPIRVLANDSDPDGDTVSMWGRLIMPSFGTLEWSPSESAFFYIPNPNYHGTDYFTYRIVDGHGGSATARVNITVTSVNDPPMAEDDTVTTNEDTPAVILVQLNDSDIDSGSIDVTAVTQPYHGQVVINPDRKTLTYTPTANYSGADFFIYTITDSDGGTDQARVDITVTPVNDLPVAVDDSAATDEDTPVTITVLANDSDIDGDALSLDEVGRPTAGSAVVNADGTATYTPNPNYFGPDSFTYRVSDGHGGTATGTVSITVAPIADPPVAVNDSAVTDEDTSAVIAVLANDSDADGDTLTVTGLTQPANGTAVLNADGTVTYTPAANFNGADSFTYTVSDGSTTATATVSITVNAVNDAPIAGNDTASVNEDGSVNIAVLDNDSDVEGDALTVSEVTQPANGKTVINAGSRVVYTPNHDFNGSDSFTYTVSDGHGGTATATVSVAVAAVNDPPIAVNDTVTLAEDTKISIPVLSNDSDPDGDPLIVGSFTPPSHGQAVINPDGTMGYTPNANYYGADSFTYKAEDSSGAASAAATVNITVVAVPDPPVAVNDEATVAEDTASGVLISPLLNDYDPDNQSLLVYDFQQPDHGQVIRYPSDPNRLLVYIPGPNFSGVDYFQYRVIDPTNRISASASVRVTVTPLPDPTHALDDSAITPEDTAIVIPVLHNDSDPDGPLTISNVTDPLHGTAVIDPGQTSITYTPDPNFFGTDAFFYTATDGQSSDTARVMVNVTAVPDPPDAKDDFATVQEDPVAAVRIPVLDNDRDPDSDPITITAATQPAHGHVSFTSGEVFYLPDRDYNGPDSFTYTITSRDGSDTATVSVTVIPVNDPPVAMDDTAVTDEEVAVTIAVLANDSDVESGTPELSSVTQPAHGTAVSNADGTVTYTPAANFNGTDSFTYTVKDGPGGLSATATVTITVTPINDPPVAANDSATVNEDGAVTMAVLANDSDADGDALSVSAVTQPANGQAAINPDGTISYAPNANFNGMDSFAYTISDGNGGTATATVTVTVNAVNDPPAAVNDAVTTAEDNAVIIAVLANDSDPDGDALSVTGITQPAHGATVLNGNGTITYSPSANYNGADSFTYTISDGNGGTTTATVNITVTPVNDAPIAVDGTAVCNEDGQASGILPAADPDGDLLAYQIVSPPTSGSVTILGNGFTYTPNANFSGTDSFTYQVSDGVLGSFVATILIMVNPANDAPTADAGGPYSILSGQAVTLDAAASSDPDEEYGDTITSYEWDLDNDGSYELSGATATSTAAWADLLGYLGSPLIGQAYPVTLQVTDSAGATATASTSLTINNTAPLANCGGPYTITWGQGITLNGSGSYDPDQACGDSIHSYAWDLNGDGTIDVTGASPTHTVTWAQLVSLLSGTISIEHTYPISLLVVDSFGATGSAITSVIVANTPPAAAFSFAPTAPTTADTVNFTDSSTDLEGAIASWAWNFGDGATSTTRNPTHRYLTTGTRTVTLTVTDANGATGVITHEIAVTQAGNTQPGSPVTVNPGSGVSVTFTNVTNGGDTTVTTSTNPPHGGPQGIKFNNTYYDISTNAGYTGTVTIAIAYNPAEVHGNEAQLKLFHSDGSGGWQNVTTYVDTVNHIIYGQVTSFSWFAIGWDTYDWLGFLPPISDTSKAFKRNSTIPIKFRISRNGQPVPNAIATLSIYYLVNGAPSGEAQVVSTSGADTGNQFRYSAGDDLYIFNLNTKEKSYIANYTYLAEVTLDDGTVYTVQFSLK